MSDDKTDDPAFPVPYSNESDGPTVMPTIGMSLRDYFASRAMPPIHLGAVEIAKAGGGAMEYSEIASLAYKMADAMLAERSKP